MPRNSIHDIKPSIKLRKSKGYESRRLEHDEDEYEEVLPKKRKRDIYDNPYETENRSGGGKVIWYVAVFCILLLVFTLSYFFSSAKVIVTPRSGNIDINKLIVASKNPLDNKSLSFNVVTLSGEESVTVSNTEKKYVERKATGKVKIFNNNGPEAQKLLIDTRLEAPDGKIYKTVKAVVVPGKQGTTPGSVEVEIYADIPGEEYNKPETDFKIFGFKGNPKYQTIYAKSVGPISGGFKGDTFALSPEEDSKQRIELEDKLKQNLISKARAELPEGFIVYDKVVIFEKEEAEIISNEDENKIVLNGNIHAFIFKTENLTRELVKDVVSDFDKNKVIIEDIEKLDISLMSESEIDPSTVSSINLSIKGDTEIVWDIDDEMIKDAILGIKERSFESKISPFKSIEKAELIIKPVWKKTVPEDKDKITIINSYKKE